MLVSQTYNNLHADYEDFPLTTNERNLSSQKSPEKTSTNASCCSSSSSPLTASSPDLTPSVNIEGCDNNLMSLREGSQYSPLDSLTSQHSQSKTAPSTNVRSPPPPHPPDMYCGSMQIPSVTHPVGEGSSHYASSDAFNGTYKHPAFQHSEMTKQDLVYGRKQSHDITLEKALSSASLQQPITQRRNYEHITDKELRKKLKNRESAQAARDRKKAKMLNLERQINELLDRNRVVENENRDLRLRIRRMESSSCWDMSKQEQMNITHDAAYVHSPYAGAMITGHQQGQIGNGSMSYANSDSHCGTYAPGNFGGYSQPQVMTTIKTEQESEKSSLLRYDHLQEEREYPIEDFVQNIWPSGSSGQSMEHSHSYSSEATFGSQIN
ncbi:uncharacterized protein LOC143461132 [Clavelina lepadiformis]|uniref:X-box-binding protein 1 n=1 Tax=Clavelina lepadiformis TaxID=159417 RepID=A0ABP0F9B2_CLALP